MKLVAILLLFLVLGGVIYTLVGRTPASTEALAGPTPPEEVGTIPATLDAPEPAEPLEPTPAAEERTAILEAEVVAEEPAVALDLLQGSVIFVDDSGGQVVKPSGTIEWLKWVGNTGHRGAAEVTDGTFELDVTEAETLSVASLVLEGQTAMPDEPDRRYPIDQGPIVVHAHRTRATLLSVLSEETGLHLGHVTVVKTTSWLDDDGEHPGLVRKGATVFTDVSSPLEYRPDSADARSAGKTFFVHSPGYAWQPIRLDLNSGGESTVPRQSPTTLAPHSPLPTASGGGRELLETVAVPYPLMRTRPSMAIPSRRRPCSSRQALTTSRSSMRRTLTKRNASSRSGRYAVASSWSSGRNARKT